MTEAEWLTCEDPVPMLEFLRGPYTVKPVTREVIYERVLASERKSRLLCVACCRRQWRLVDEASCSRLLEFGNRLRREGYIHRPRLKPGLPLGSCQRALELAEQAADGLVDEKEWNFVSDAARSLTVSDDYPPYDCTDLGDSDVAVLASGYVAGAIGVTGFGKYYFSHVRYVLFDIALATAYLRHTGREVIKEGDKREQTAQVTLLHDIFGNPFRSAAFAPQWRTDTAVTLARQMYDAREFGAMPILADALQDAGCDNPGILDHCRDVNQVHVRGCWVVDLVLGKS